MSEDNITIEYDLHQKIDVDISISEVIHEINNLPVRLRFNVCATIINQLRTEIDELTPDEKNSIKTWLQNKLEIFSA